MSKDEPNPGNGMKGPIVEVHVGRSVGAAASGADSRLSPEQIAALQTTLTELISGFRPPESTAPSEGLHLESLEVELGFKVETGSGGLLKLLLDAKGEASIKATVVWSRSK